MYTFSLLTASGTSIDPSVKARIASITVAASDDPFGIIQFQSPLIRNVSEDIGFVNLTVIRSGGSIGQLSVNYSVTSTTATQGMDYESLGSGTYSHIIKQVSFTSKIKFQFVLCSGFAVSIRRKHVLKRPLPSKNYLRKCLHF